ncbi:hypothetical protein CLAFUW4_13726 [Fulvia fulva]|uniref:Zn(2)-C6 fungal-type domain-containing protein n=1 Tax=Passalora fulva TaxID=5499 RepID=A0A9Q8PL76_PASFU|nr:uncharacterized protein CLAFUR5_13574 [Fulvia fulva]KAK4610082.1 hypothetical protein CLAFUR4_13729 [Fulvia fulva]KAK4611036.1 hypothetical protein CLAFUR0_13733 [Fulvia fulva]UJO24442.1 hypothetical protein CLAFUR5_13574 [Fulvia fulva]WPV21793.1 hypothetical protein CLAFUW4_13726 [Fulvia fulva]WPV36843.1 hypothetical protein CLAFUW7_13734 [Fulvia fulva]
MKRGYQQMMEQTPISLGMNGVAYQDFSGGHYYSPPLEPPQHILFSNPFPTHGEYVQEGYLPSSESSFYSNSRSLSEPFNIHQPTESFGSSSSASSSCSASVAPATPPPVIFTHGPTKFPAVPITPSHQPPRQKAKRTATACEECRKRKQKCDGEGPCQSCKEQKLDCKYREVSPTKKDNSMERLVALVENCSKSMEALNQRLDIMSTTLQQIEARLTSCWQCGSKVALETGACDSCNYVPCRL